MRGHRSCLQCGSVTRNKLFCSNYCRAKYGKYKVYDNIDKKICKYCGDTFIRDDSSLFCSIECEYNYCVEHDVEVSDDIKNFIEEIENDKLYLKKATRRNKCVMCNKVIKSEDKRKYKNLRRHFCSLKCVNYYKQLPRIIKKRCSICGKVYYVNLYELEHDLKLVCNNCVSMRNKFHTKIKVCNTCKCVFKVLVDEKNTEYCDSDLDFCCVDCKDGKDVRNKRKFIDKSVKRLLLFVLF